MTIIQNYAVRTMALGGVQARNSVGPDYTTLTPDTLMAYCQSRLRDLDSSLMSKMGTQRNILAQKEWCNEIDRMLTDHSQGFDNKAHVDQMTTRLYELKAAMQNAKNEGAANTIQSVIDKINVAGDGIVTKEELQEATNMMKSVSKDLDANSEMNMIEMQSVMSSRQQAIQLTTNLVQSLGQQLNMIAQNVGK
jgi:hypothetical protein